MLNVVVCCGGGIVTTTIVTDKLKEITAREKIPATFTPRTIVEIPAIVDADIIVVTGKTKQQNNSGIPVMIGMSLFTGMGEEKFVQEFLAKAREIEKEKK